MLSLYRQQIISSWFSRVGNSFFQHHNWSREWDPNLLGWTDEPDIIIYLMISGNQTYGTPEPWCDKTLIPISNTLFSRYILYPSYAFVCVQKNHSSTASATIFTFMCFLLCNSTANRWNNTHQSLIRLWLWKEQIISTWLKSRQLLGNGLGRQDSWCEVQPKRKQS